jgi:hypothetical protein
MHTYGPELVKKMRDTAFANEFYQTATNPIAPEICFWEHVQCDGQASILCQIYPSSEPKAPTSGTPEATCQASDRRERDGR